MAFYAYNEIRCLKNNMSIFIYIGFMSKEVDFNENDISAKEKIQSKSSRIQSKNEHSRRKKSFSCQKSKRKKTVISLGRIYVAFSSIKKCSISRGKSC